MFSATPITGSFTLRGKWISFQTCCSGTSGVVAHCFVCVGGLIHRSSSEVSGRVSTVKHLFSTQTKVWSNCSPLSFGGGGQSPPVNDCIEKERCSLSSRPSFPLPVHSLYVVPEDHANVTSSEEPSCLPQAAGTVSLCCLNLGPPACMACPRLCSLFTRLWHRRGQNPHPG